MGYLSERLKRAVFGDSDVRVAGQVRAMRGLREADRNELIYGLALLGLAYLRKTAPRRQLIHRQSVSPGTALVIHHTKRGEPRLEIVKPRKRR